MRVGLFLCWLGPSYRRLRKKKRRSVEAPQELLAWKYARLSGRRTVGDVTSSGGPDPIWRQEGVHACTPSFQQCILSTEPHTEPAVATQPPPFYTQPSP